MISGNGRHRRPRQAPALLVAAGVAGSAIAIPLLGAASANAADGTTWDKVAECESGGSWSADTGNGYYGGLQMSQDDWDKYGGLDYASSPDEASRSQQIAVAEKILDDQGTTPWATCALLSGLTSDSGSVDVDPGVGSSGSSDSGDSSGSSDSSDSSGSSDSSHSSSGSDSSSKGSSSSKAGAGKGADAKHGSKGSADSSKSDKSESSGSNGSQGSGSSPTETVKSDDSDNSWQDGGSWSLVDTGAIGGGRHRGVSADESEANGQGAESSGRHASQGYTVRDGDTLASIADSLGLDGGWRALYAANKAAIGADPNDITPGQTLELGAEKGGK
ncbi:transglycosylase family protein [Streptomyces sp. NPDC086549]|uniref:LysM peptidoglycan-binding domain-containing protein n=1 Tax=Streptomyces sp. NPDC086549 TaxID=3365752 RepID=UPI00382B4341